MAAVLIALLALSALAWTGFLRRGDPHGWIACLVFGFPVALAVFLASRIGTAEPLLPVLVVAVGTGAILALAARLFLGRLALARPSWRFLYHGALLVLTAAVAAFFPFRTFRAERIPTGPPPDLSARHHALASRFGLNALNVTVHPSSRPGAQVTSFTGDAATITVTRGLAELFDRDEMDFALAHELSHHALKHYPLRVGLAAVGLLFYFIASAWLLRRRRAPPDADPSCARETETFLRWIPVHLTLVLAASLGPLAYCRAQEAEADRKAVEVTGNPAAARSALEKLAAAVPDRREDPLEFLAVHPDIAKRMRLLK
jgi:Zn-dependent protease with chaperone function